MLGFIPVVQLCEFKWYKTTPAEVTGYKDLTYGCAVVAGLDAHGSTQLCSTTVFTVASRGKAEFHASTFYKKGYSSGTQTQCTVLYIKALWTF